MSPTVFLVPGTQQALRNLFVRWVSEVAFGKQRLVRCISQVKILSGVRMSGRAPSTLPQGVMVGLFPRSQHKNGVYVTG